MRVETRVVGLSELAETVKKHKQQGHRVVLCHGVFDLLHIGHIRYFRQAAQMEIGRASCRERVCLYV